VVTTVFEAAVQELLMNDEIEHGLASLDNAALRREELRQALTADRETLIGVVEGEYLQHEAAELRLSQQAEVFLQSDPRIREATASLEKLRRKESEQRSQFMPGANRTPVEDSNNRTRTTLFSRVSRQPAPEPETQLGRTVDQVKTLQRDLTILRNSKLASGLPPEVENLRSAAAALRSSLVATLVEQALLPYARSWITTQLQRDYAKLWSTNFPGLLDSPPIRLLPGAELLIETPSSLALSDLMRQLGGGAIGISGGRGTGKSTIIDQVCGQLRRDGAVTIVTSAPVAYETRDFLTHLLLSICNTIAPQASPADPPEAEPSNAIRTRRMRVALGAVLGGAVGASGAAILLDVFRSSFDARKITAVVLLTLLAVAPPIVSLLTPRNARYRRSSRESAYVLTLTAILAGVVARVLTDPRGPFPPPLSAPTRATVLVGLLLMLLTMTLLYRWRLFYSVYLSVEAALGTVVALVLCLSAATTNLADSRRMLDLVLIAAVGTFAYALMPWLDSRLAWSLLRRSGFATVSAAGIVFAATGAEGHRATPLGAALIAVGANALGFVLADEELRRHARRRSAASYPSPPAYETYRSESRNTSSGGSAASFAEQLRMDLQYSLASTSSNTQAAKLTASASPDRS
jgi:hypothetical protein